MSCDICGRPTVEKYCKTTNWLGEPMADVSACSAICAGMLSVMAVPKEAWLHRLEVWEAKRRRADVEGRDFTEPPPLSPTEAELRVRAIRYAAHGVTP